MASLGEAKAWIQANNVLSVSGQAALPNRNPTTRWPVMPRRLGRRPGYPQLRGPTPPVAGDFANIGIWVFGVSQIEAPAGK